MNRIPTKSLKLALTCMATSELRDALREVEEKDRSYEDLRDEIARQRFENDLQLEDIEVRLLGSRREDTVKSALKMLTKDINRFARLESRYETRLTMNEVTKRAALMRRVPIEVYQKLQQSPWKKIELQGSSLSS